MRYHFNGAAHGMTLTASSCLIHCIKAYPYVAEPALASLLQNADPDVRVDMETFLSKVVPEVRRFEVVYTQFQLL